jgi:hypothetical protein
MIFGFNNFFRKLLVLKRIRKKERRKENILEAEISPVISSSLSRKKKKHL